MELKALGLFKEAAVAAGATFTIFSHIIEHETIVMDVQIPDNVEIPELLPIVRLNKRVFEIIIPESAEADDDLMRECFNKNVTEMVSNGEKIEIRNFQRREHPMGTVYAITLLVHEVPIEKE